jgi:tetratricopeptide (TPR) repeat protein
MSEHTEALASFQRTLAADPDNRAALYNAGMAAYLAGLPDQSVTHWGRLKALEPQDWRVRSKLIQAYQALGRLPQRDAERAELLRMRGTTQDDELKRAKNYCRDQFAVGEARVMALEFFDLEGETPIRYSFDLLDDSGQRVVARYTLGSYAATNAIALESGQIQAGQRLFHLDGYKPGGVHETYGFMVGEPGYDEVKAAVTQILQGTWRPVSGTRPTSG